MSPTRPTGWTEPPSGQQGPTGAADPEPVGPPPPMPDGSETPPDGQQGPRDTMPNRHQPGRGKTL